jgi:nucleotide-binding universal stress UspA family protein
MFERMVVGVDGSPAGFEALRQARRLLDPGGTVTAVTVVTPGRAAHAGYAAVRVADELWAEANEARARAEEELSGLAGAEARLVQGRPIPALHAVVADERADLVAAGTHGGTRVAGIVFGSVATALLHEAPCSVLLARPPGDPGRFPRRIVVDYDGSSCAGEAIAVAEGLGRRFEASVRTVVATGGKPMTVEGFAWREGIEKDERDPVTALVAASEDADLLVVGSRGQHGLAALGSVSERVAHQAGCSVLVVRPAESDVPAGTG